MNVFSEGICPAQGASEAAVFCFCYIFFYQIKVLHWSLLTGPKFSSYYTWSMKEYLGCFITTNSCLFFREFWKHWILPLTFFFFTFSERKFLFQLILTSFCERVVKAIVLWECSGEGEDHIQSKKPFFFSIGHNDINKEANERIKWKWYSDVFMSLMNCKIVVVKEGLKVKKPFLSFPIPWQLLTSY